MQSIYFTIFSFVYISKKKPLFRGVNSYKPFLDIYFCPKRKNQTTFGKWYFVFLYILFIFILKETYTIPFYTGHWTLDTRHWTLDTRHWTLLSTGAIAGVAARHYTAVQRNYCITLLCRHSRGKPEITGVPSYR